MRFKIIRIVIVLLVSTITLGLIYNQVIRGQYYYTLSRNNRIRVVPREGQRGKVFDRNGIVLVNNRVSFNVSVIPQELRRKDELFFYLSHVLEVNKGDLEKTFQKKRMAPFAPVIVAKDIPMSKAVHLEENKFFLPGLIVDVSSQREYPFKDIGAHLLGYIGTINRLKKTRLKEYGYTAQSIVGYSGVEEYYDSYLEGKDGGLQIEVNNRGEQVQLLGSKAPVSGEDIFLTIDSRIQKVAQSLIRNKKGAVVVIDFESGEILSLVSSPSFDPNSFVRKRSGEVSKYFTNPDAPLLNRAIGGQYPPGSVFKIPLAISALEEGLIVPKTTFQCPGFLKLGRRKFRCAHTHGVQNLNQAIAHSCNVYFFNVGMKTGPDLMGKYAKLFGLGSLTNIDLPYEAAGFIPGRGHRARPQRGWFEGDTLNMAIGQGEVLVTPLQLANMVAIVARNGQKISPHIIRIIGRSKPEKYITKKDIMIKQKTFDIVKAGMRAAVGDYSGTAHFVDIKGLEVYGKTGTAQSTRGRLSHSWFVGFCPNAKTKIAFCVFLEHGGSSYYAVQLARDLLLQMQKWNIL